MARDKTEPPGSFPRSAGLCAQLRGTRDPKPQWCPQLCLHTEVGWGFGHSKIWTRLLPSWLRWAPQAPLIRRAQDLDVCLGCAMGSSGLIHQPPTVPGSPRLKPKGTVPKPRAGFLHGKSRNASHGVVTPSLELQRTRQVTLVSHKRDATYLPLQPSTWRPPGRLPGLPSHLRDLKPSPHPGSGDACFSPLPRSLWGVVPVQRSTVTS